MAMKIHDLCGGNRQGNVNRQKQNVTDKDDFHSIVLGQTKKDEQGSMTAKGLKSLIGDALILSAAQIKQEIDLACECETGEKIDMMRLGELLKLHREFEESDS